MNSSKRKIIFAVVALDILITVGLIYYYFGESKFSRTASGRNAGQPSQLAAAASKAEQTNDASTATDSMSAGTSETTPTQSSTASSGQTTAPTSASTPEEKKRKMTPEEMQSLSDALKRDDICEVWRLTALEDSPMLPLDFLADQLFQFENQVRGYTDQKENEITVVIRALAKGDATGMLKVLETSRSEPVDFYRALVIGGYMSSPELNANPPNLNLAIEMLSSLADRFPDNAMHLFALAAMRNRRGESIESLRHLYVKAARAPRFDDFFTSITRKIMERAFASTSYFWVGVHLSSQVQIPDWIGLHRGVRDYLKTTKDPELAQATLALGRKLMEGAEQYNRLQPNVFWQPLHHAVGLNVLARNSWKNLYGETPFPDDLAKTYKEYINEDSQKLQMAAVDPLTNALTKGRVPASDCPRQGVDAMVHGEFETFQTLMRAGR